MERFLISDVELSILEKLHDSWMTSCESDKKQDSLKAKEISYIICSMLPRLIKEIRLHKKQNANKDNQ
jgi:hypothetical protein